MPEDSHGDFKPGKLLLIICLNVSGMWMPHSGALAKLYDTNVASGLIVTLSIDVETWSS